MACSGSGSSEDQASDQLSKTLKQGERILAPTRRPDGTLRKPIRIRAGYVPQEEVAIYHPKPALVSTLCWNVGFNHLYFIMLPCTCTHSL